MHSIDYSQAAADGSGNDLTIIILRSLRASGERLMRPFSSRTLDMGMKSVRLQENPQALTRNDESSPPGLMKTLYRSPSGPGVDARLCAKISPNSSSVICQEFHHKASKTPSLAPSRLERFACAIRFGDFQACSTARITIRKTVIDDTGPAFIWFHNVEILVRMPMVLKYP